MHSFDMVHICNKERYRAAFSQNEVFGKEKFKFLVLNIFLATYTLIGVFCSPIDLKVKFIISSLFFFNTITASFL